MSIPRTEKPIMKFHDILLKATRSRIIMGFEHIRAKSEAANMQRLQMNEYSDTSSIFNIYDNDINVSFNANITMISDISHKNSIKRTVTGRNESNMNEETQSDFLKNYLTFQNEETKQLMTNALKLGMNDTLQDEFIKKMEKREEEIMSVVSQQFDDVSAYAEHLNSKLDLEIDQMNDEYKKPDKSLTRTDYIQKDKKIVGNFVFPKNADKLGRSSLVNVNTRRVSGTGKQFIANPTQNLQTSLIESEVEADEEEYGFKPKRFSDVMNNSLLRNEALNMLNGKSRGENSKLNNDMLASMITHKNTSLKHKNVSYTKEMIDTQEIPEEDESVSVSISQGFPNEYSQKLLENKYKQQITMTDESYNKLYFNQQESLIEPFDKQRLYKQDTFERNNKNSSIISIAGNCSNHNSKMYIKMEFKSMEQEVNPDSLSVSGVEPKSQFKDSKCSPRSSGKFKFNRSVENIKDNQNLIKSEFQDAIIDSQVNYSTNDKIKKISGIAKIKRGTVDSENSLAKKFSIKDSEYEDDFYTSGHKKLSNQSRGLNSLSKRNTIEESSKRNSHNQLINDILDPNMLSQMSKKRIDFNLRSDKSIDPEKTKNVSMIDEYSMESDTDSSFYAKNNIESNKHNFDNKNSGLISIKDQSNVDKEDFIIEESNYHANSHKIQQTNLNSKQNSSQEDFNNEHYNSIDEAQLYINKGSNKNNKPTKFSFAVPVAQEEINQTFNTDRVSHIDTYKNPTITNDQGYNSLRELVNPHKNILKSMEDNDKDQEKFRKLFESEFNEIEDYSYKKPLKYSHDFNTFKEDSDNQFFMTKDIKIRNSLVNSDLQSDQNISNIFEDNKTHSITDKANDVFSYNKFNQINRDSYDTLKFQSQNINYGSEVPNNNTSNNGLNYVKNGLQKHLVTSKQDPNSPRLKSSEVQELDVQEWVRSSHIDVPIIRIKEDTGSFEDDNIKMNVKKSYFSEYNSANNKNYYNNNFINKELVNVENTVPVTKLFDIKESIEFKDSNLLKHSSLNNDKTKVGSLAKEISSTYNSKVSANLSSTQKMEENIIRPNIVNSINNLESFKDEKSLKTFDSNKYLRSASVLINNINSLERKLNKYRLKALLSPFLMISMLKLFKTDSRMNILFLVLSKLVQLKTRSAYDVIYKYCVEYFKSVYQIQQLAKKLKRITLLSTLKDLKSTKLRVSERRKIRKSELKMFIATFDHIKRNKIYDCFVKIQFLNKMPSLYGSLVGQKSVEINHKGNRQYNASYYDTLEDREGSLIKIKDLNEDTNEYKKMMKNSISPTKKKMLAKTKNIVNSLEGNFFDYLSKAQSNKFKEEKQKSKRNSITLVKIPVIGPSTNAYGTTNRKDHQNQQLNNSSQLTHISHDIGLTSRRFSGADSNNFMKNSQGAHSNNYDKGQENSNKGDLIMKTLSQINVQLKRLNNEQVIEEEHLEEYILERLVDILDQLNKLEIKTKRGLTIDNKEIQEIYQILTLLIDNLTIYARENQNNSNYISYLDILKENIQFVDTLAKKSHGKNKNFEVSESNQFKFKGLTHMIQNLTDAIAKKDDKDITRKSKLISLPTAVDHINISSISPQTDNKILNIYRSEVNRSTYKKVSSAENFLIFLNFLVIRKKKVYGKLMYSRIKFKALEIQKSSQARRKLERLALTYKLKPIKELAKWKVVKNKLLSSLWSKAISNYQVRLRKIFSKLAAAYNKDTYNTLPRSSMRSFIEGRVSLTSIRKINDLRASGSNMNIDIDRPNRLRKSINPSQGNIVVKNIEEDFFYLNLEENYMQKVCQNKSLNMSLNKSLSKLGSL